MSSRIFSGKQGADRRIFALSCRISGTGLNVYRLVKKLSSTVL
jgi:hypothetical protein